jgi:hypothetical protein
MKSRFFTSLTCLILLAVGLRPVSAQSLAEKRQDRIDKTSRYLVETYSRQMKDGGEFVGLLSVLAISRVDHTAATEKLLSVAREHQSPAVRAFAWEALHTRRPSLSEQQTRQWLASGAAIAAAGGMSGSFRLGLIRALRSRPADDFDGANREALLKLIAQADHRSGSDRPVLKALRQTVGLWRDEELTRQLILRLENRTLCNTAEYALGGLQAGIAPIGSADPRVPYDRTAWRQVRDQWLGWLNEARLDGPGPGALPTYDGRGTFFPPPQTVDPQEKSWYEDLELDPVDLQGIEICFAIDSTGSMKSVMRWVARDVGRMVQVFGAVSGEVRTGVVFFRDEISGEPQPDRYEVKNLQLTTDTRALARKLQAEPAGGGKGRGAAMLKALQTALSRQGWSRNPKTGRVIVLMSDTHPLDGNLPEIQRLVRGGVQRGFVFHTIRVGQPSNARRGPYLEELTRIAQWGGGQSPAMEFRDRQQKQTEPRSRLPWGPVALPTAGPPESEVTRDFIRQILVSLLPEDHWKRVDPLMDLLMAYIRQG